MNANADMLRMPEPGHGVMGKAYWRSLDQLADTPAFRDWVERRFPQSMRELLAGGVDRRKFLHLMAASLGLAGLAGCRRPEIGILPYTKRPEEVVPGLPTFYASAMPRPGGAFPVLVESHEGRPTKIEGNPRHAASAGTTDAFAQASVLDLYDPDRSRAVLHQGQPATWQSFDQFAAAHFAALREKRGRGLCILTEDVCSPALDLVSDHVRKVMPEASWYVFEPVDAGNARAGAALAFGKPFVPRYHFEKAQVVVALDSDFLGLEDDGVRHVHGFAQARRVEPDGDPSGMNRLYAVESQYTLTGGMADHRLRLPSSHVLAYCAALASEVLRTDLVVPLPGSAEDRLRQALGVVKPPKGIDPRWISEVAADLRAHRGQCLVVAGHKQPPLVHALAHLINAVLGNLGQTFELRDLPERPAAGTLHDLAQAIEQGKVETLVILGANPAYSAPADIDFAALMKRVATTICSATHVDETSELATWHVPAAHYLESWGDARTSDGTLVAIQPLIEPLFGGRSTLELLAGLGQFETTSAYEIVRRAFRETTGISTAAFEPAWRQFLHEGLQTGTAYPLIERSLDFSALASAAGAARIEAPALSPAHLELVLVPDASVADGRFANNGWLQEIPDPISKITWDNAAIFSPQTAGDLGVATGDLGELGLGELRLEIAALVLPGQADHSVAVALGYGRRATGRVGRGVGFDAYRLRTTSAPQIALGLSVAKTGRRHILACTQDHFTMEGRAPVRELDLGGMKAFPVSLSTEAPPEEIRPGPHLEGEHQWGMVVDLNTCVGCSACVAACQSENNIPIVGKEEVARGREMHWIRIDRYFSGSTDEPALVHQPMACVQCENAPCEVVCPVNATVHTEDGLNAQVYNRCIGTRYCMNNCPYKVRRFNFFNYNERPLGELREGPLAAKGMPETLKMQKNPAVSVRIRGVVEKCTYCVQRIERGKIGARVAAGDTSATRVPDGTIVPACAQACPAQAITFGDLKDPESRVSRLKRQSHNYAVLGDLNTRPRTSYLARFRNPNPRMINRASAPTGVQA